mgnify:CR=1 FL=1
MFGRLNVTVGRNTIEFDGLELLQIAEEVLSNADTFPTFVPETNFFKKLMDLFDLTNLNHLQQLIENYPILTVPMRIMGLKTPKEWLYVIKKLSTPALSLKGWWIEIGGRLLCVKNDPNDYHLYISDYGNVAYVSKDTYDHVQKHGEWVDPHYALMMTEVDAHIGSLDAGGRARLSEGLGEHIAKTTTLEEIKAFQPELSDAEARELLQNTKDPAFMAQNLLKFDESHRYMMHVLVKKYMELKFQKMPHFDNAIYQRCGVYDMSGNPVSYTDPNMWIQYDALAKKIIRTIVLKEVAIDVNDGGHEPLYRPVESFGERDRGEGYRKFYDHLKEYFYGTPSQERFTQHIRGFLSGGGVNTQAPSYTPNLVGALFVSEASRNILSFLTTLVIADLVESSVQYKEAGVNLYHWLHVLVHPSEVPKKANGRYSNKLGGCLPMCHQGAVEQAKSLPSAMEPGASLNRVRSKEAHLLIHWLVCMASRKIPGCSMHPVAQVFEKKSKRKASTSVSIAFLESEVAKKKKRISKTEGTVRAKKSKNPDADVSKQEGQLAGLRAEVATIEASVTLKRKLIDLLIKPLLMKRVSTFSNMLSSDFADFDWEAVRNNPLFSPIGPAAGGAPKKSDAPTKADV